MNNLYTRVTKEFKVHFTAEPSIVVRAPGRVNLIGEHTDYNDGYVLPMAIDRAAWIALRPRPDRQVHIYSANLDDTAVFSLDGLEKGDGWVEYLKAVAWALQTEGFALNGWEGVLVGDVPIGAGLSSSAALELALARAFAAVSDWDWSPVRMAQISQKAENQWVGIQSGIMDQMISAVGRADHALLIDCRTLEHELTPLPPETTVLALDTATRRGLVDSAYNERREQCEIAARFFGVPALRDVLLPQFQARAHELDELIRRRARHVISENERTQAAARAMRRQDAVTLGQLMDESHASLRDDYEVSSNELNAIVGSARRQPGCYGARMTGAGFGGCAVALVAAEKAETIATAVAAEYEADTGLQPNVYITTASDGATLLT